MSHSEYVRQAEKELLPIFREIDHQVKKNYLKY